MLFFRPADPCRHKCELDEETDRCLGCGRRVSDMVTWSGLTSRQRKEALAEADAFLKARDCRLETDGAA